MPELPDIALYVAALETRVVGRTLRAVRIEGPAWLRSVEPPIAAAGGRRVTGVSRLGKRVVLALEGDLFLVLHLMIAGRLQWRDGAPRAAAGRRGKTLGALEFENGTLTVTEAGTRKRATLHLLRGRDALAALDPGGLEPLGVSRDAFAERLRARNHTVKRALTDPHVFSGIGNAYSDEILHAARLSPFKQTQKLTDEEIDRLHAATRDTLTRWCERLRAEVGDAWPAKVTAFRPEMAVHGKYREPCPACGAPVQRIAYAENEANYCARCQTGGKLLADRALSQLLKDDWPRTLEEMEERRPASGVGAVAARAAPRSTRSRRAPRRAPE
jgi:formamidopyrimidine-DNA glycosylase